jgi:hypothetical protein
LRSTPEEILKDIPEALSVTEVLREVAALKTARSPAKIFGIKVWIQRNFAELVVLFFPLFIRENRIGGRNPLELFFGLGIALVSVRVIFLGETAIGLLDRGRIGGPRNTEFCVRILALMAIQWLLVASPVRVDPGPDASSARV